ncbi:SpoIVB peptidase [Eubacteriales bacterium OttesenSCG-928-N13]|nr:SpoIVB peptidase [Eubacteriales bacterium OttesenSCG-928-N13]
MTKTKLKHAIGYLLSALVLALGLSPGSQTLSKMPSTIRLTEGYSAELKMPSSIRAQLRESDACVLSGMDEQLGDVDPSYMLTGEAPGDAQLVLSMLGVPVKTVTVSVQPERTVMPGGQSIGVALAMGGALVVGTSDVGNQKSPARQAGLRAGDRIVGVNGNVCENASMLSDLLIEDSAVLTIVRDEQEQLVPVRPIKDARDGSYRLGAWVRDSTAGVGTLSFYDPNSGMFAALGHAITDVDTGTILPVEEGYIYESHIVDVLRGESGEPGELMGEFFDEEKQIGSVDLNTEIGLYGASDEPMLNELYPAGVKLMQRSEVKTGAAKLITTISGGDMQEYDCEIVRLYQQDSATPRSMVVKITDERLLSATGGIVQGMSGSPILQDGRLVGAVTHVFINDPTQGYGLYAEWMLEKCDAA